MNSLPIRARHVIPIRLDPALYTYTAFVAGDCVDVGGPLFPFIHGLRETFSESEEDIAIWRLNRLVAVLRPGPRGLSVTWL